jgi:hypothetical protein
MMEERIKKLEEQVELLQSVTLQLVDDVISIQNDLDVSFTVINSLISELNSNRNGGEA